MAAAKKKTTAKPRERFHPAPRKRNEVRSGYTACACRDCFDTTISSNVKKPELCSECKDAGCEHNAGECQRSDAYGG